ncbi:MULTISPECIES: VWA domain-containing protein [Streptomyces]|uniref:Ca-activated chloride channel family protein n=1 Tax=Streptomyces clavifer TaxID=68188 RepID=A0ABS4V1U0_9ACTN|nr:MULTISPECIES: VWA domain-containing protein [Streptomyces]MBP2357831.1 Ca-activated chloride channel family protein [Streptomyces clavifer]MDX2742496.1 VWA domain-containing protein [Streptomyces sp. NRRL_B-2557]RPK84496.1 von Willebrand factor type A domain protein [Streptomyces sp. ADI97-07]WRY85369.1 VWA domain-containing protein [Streptomyces clavifer]WUC31072.1 VWA domain-containing protein [Streptomyces clavifer]
MITRKRLTAGVGILLATLAAGLGTALPAAADEPSSAASPKVELVLDVSGSMRTRDIDGQSRISAAKQAFNDVLDAVPEEVQLGIRTLGADYPGDDRKVGCKDTKQLYPVGPLDRTEAKTAVATLAPTGWTPIGPALLGAADDLEGGDSTRRIVLITDGEDTCGPLDPCEVARDIAARGIHLVIDTLGLVPNAKIRQQLTCIAEATGGTYTAIQHTEELSGRVKQLVDRAAEPVVTPVATEGAGSCSAAPQLKAGLYTDRQEFGKHRWYRVDVLPGQELRASVSVAADRAVNNDYGVLLRAVTVHGREIVRGAESGTGRTDAISSGLRYPKAEQDDVDGDVKPAAETVCLQLSNSFAAPSSVKTTPGMPVELTIDLVGAPDDAADVAAFGLGRGWWLLGVMVLTGLVAGLLFGWISRWRVAVWRTN